MRGRGVWAGAAMVALLAGGARAADPVDDAYWRQFHIIPIGRWAPDSVAELRASLLAGTGGREPASIKLSVAEVVGSFMQSTQGAYLDFIYEPYYPPDFDYTRGWELTRMMAIATAENIRVSHHVNGMPWGDDWNQSRPVLHNFLETYDDGTGPGAFLQRDRQGRIRSGFSMDPTVDENPNLLGALEMQLTLSPYATMVRRYWERNLRMATRLAQYHRDIHPDLVVLISGSSEIAQNSQANIDFSDYGRFSAAEFRDWLIGRGLYAGRGQYADLAALNAAFSVPTRGAPPAGFPLTSVTFETMTPPTATGQGGDLFITITNTGRWFLKWHEFRVAQVRHLVVDQARISTEMGWSPDRVFGHQVPGGEIPTDGSPLPTSSLFERLYASPTSTTFGPLFGNGITTYREDAEDRALFARLYNEDRHWGIFEYNPVRLVGNDFVPATREQSDAGLAAVWDAKARAISPYLWDGGLTGALAPYTIRSRPFEAALRDFIAARAGQPMQPMERHEAHPDSRSPIWEMNGEGDVEASEGFSRVEFAGGRLTAAHPTGTPSIVLRFDESPTRALRTDEYAELGLRAAHVGTGFRPTLRVEWLDRGGATGSVSIRLQRDLRVHRVNLARHPEWLGREVTELRLRLESAGEGELTLDWVRLGATHSWLFDHPGEATGLSGFAPGAGVAAGTFAGTDNSGDGYFFLGTDRPAGTDADRVVIDAEDLRWARLRLSATEAAVGQTFWWRRGTSFFAGPAFPVAQGAQTVDVDLAAHPDWNGTVTQWRIDPVNRAGVGVAIDSVALYPWLLRPIPLVDDVILNTEFPVLLWDTPIEPGETQLRHEVQIAFDSEFSQIAVHRTGLTTGRYQHNGVPRLPNATYWWRARTVGGGERRSAWSHPMPIHLNKWNFDDTRDLYDSTARIPDVRPSDITPPVAGGGTLRMTATDTDGNGITSPFFFFNTGDTLARGINAAVYTQLRYQLRLSGGAGGTGTPQVFFFREEDTTPFHQIVLAPIPIDGQWRVIDVNLAASSGWRGHVRDLRLDPSFDRGNYTIELDWAEVTPPGAPVLGGAAHWSIF